MGWSFGESEIDGEWLDLFDAYCDGAASPAELAQLEQRLAADPRAMDAFVVYTDLNARLQRWARRARHTASILQGGESLAWNNAEESGPDGTVSTSAKIGQASRSPILGFLGNAFQAGMDFLARPPMLTLLLTIGLPGILLLILMLHIARQPAPQAPDNIARQSAPVAPVAQVTQTHKCVWGKGGAARPIGAELFAGEQLCLSEGLVEVAFDRGAKVILQGPVTFDASHRNGGFLHTGKLVGNVSKPASGFTIRTPQAVVVDLGTNFGVAVDNDGNTEAHVFKGEVEITARTEAAETSRRVNRLIAGQAVRIRESPLGHVAQIEMISATPDRFVRRLAPETTAGLPEPTIKFAHRGGRDPATEGWRCFHNFRKPVTLKDFDLAAVDDGGVMAWKIEDRTSNGSIHYRIEDKEGLTSALIAKAQTQGWVMRARVKVLDPATARDILSHFSYRGDQRAWLARTAVGKDGRQYLVLPGKSSLGNDAVVVIPQSRDRYVDYEIRYYPATEDADIYVNGRLVATGYYTTDPEKDRLQFGTARGGVGNAWYALVEWGVLHGTTEKKQAE